MNEHKFESELKKHLEKKGIDLEKFITEKQEVMERKGKFEARVESQTITLKIEKIINSRK